MLVCKTKQGDWISLVNSDNVEKLKELRKSEAFYCPECEERVILKAGTKKIPHFAHQKGAVCSESYERESEYHLKGKLALFKWLEMQGLSPELEPYMKEIAQRPDLGFTFKDRKYAIEFQCSTIPEELFFKRTENYQKADIFPIWIMAGKNVKRKGTKRVSLSKFDYLFLTRNNFGSWYLPAFCPQMNSLIMIQHILPVTVKNSLSQYVVKSLQTATISDLIFPKSVVSHKLIDWKKEMSKAKNFTLPQYGSIHHPFLRELYSNGMMPTMLPYEVGLPVRNMQFIETPAIEWQGYLYLDVLKNRKSVTMQQILHSFQKRVRDQEVKLRHLPLERNGNALMAVKVYIQLLVKLNVLKPINTTIFKVQKQWTIHDNQCNYLESEESFYRKYGKIISENL